MNRLLLLPPQLPSLGTGGRAAARRRRRQPASFVVMGGKPAPKMCTLYVV